VRHTFGTLAVQAFSRSDVTAMMGDADISTTMIYVHHVPQIDAAARLSALLDTDADGLPRRASSQRLNMHPPGSRALRRDIDVRR
jgi:hypothetical protein